MRHYLHGIMAGIGIALLVLLLVLLSGCAPRPSLDSPGEMTRSWFDQAWPGWYLGKRTVVYVKDPAAVCDGKPACMKSWDPPGPNARILIILPEDPPKDLITHEYRHALHYWNPQKDEDVTHEVGKVEIDL